VGLPEDLKFLFQTINAKITRRKGKTVVNEIFNSVTIEKILVYCDLRAFTCSVFFIGLI